MPEPENQDPTINSSVPDAASAPSLETASGAGDPASALAAAKAEAAQNYERLMRTAADLENFRRRALREKEELRLFAAARVIEELLPAIDNLGLAINAARQPAADVKALAGGVEMVLTQLKVALGNHGLKEINPAGAAFDANLHEAISAQPDGRVAEGHVVNVVRTGFALNGRLVRPASVIVSSGPGKSGAEKPAK
ncbi:MAG: nucleotide exchange factor GrpE [Opitutus sp.]|nr:nucleotide exchange factor GrpE [Opitutus sp.]